MTALAGVDLGTTTFKASILALDGRELATASCATPWRPGESGPLLEPAELMRDVRSLLRQVIDRAAAGKPAAIGVTGMAETGIAELADGTTLAGRAWNATPGHPHAAPPDFSIRTGLLDYHRATISTLHAARNSRAPVLRWFNLPEYVVSRLGGGDHVAELSLAGRTGLIGLETGTWDPVLCDWAGVDASQLAPPTVAGTPWGTAHGDLLDGAVLTVAGHDHLCAAIGGGAGVADLFDSLGTGEALVRNLPSTELEAAGGAAGLHASGAAVGFGLRPGELVALVGLGTGNRLHWLLSQLGFTGPPPGPLVAARIGATDDTDAALGKLFAGAWPVPANVLDGIARWLRTVADPAAVWHDALRLAALRTHAVRAALDEVLGAAERLICAGGWLRDPGIRAVRAAVLGEYRIPRVRESGARGAALLAGRAAGLFDERRVPTRHDLVTPSETDPPR